MNNKPPDVMPDLDVLAPDLHNSGAQRCGHEVCFVCNPEPPPPPIPPPNSMRYDGTTAMKYKIVQAGQESFTVYTRMWLFFWSKLDNCYTMEQAEQCVKSHKSRKVSNVTYLP